MTKIKTPSSTEIIPPAQKPTLILVHGFRGAPAGLNEIAKDLKAAGYPVHTPAIPPFAGAPELPSYTPDSYASFIAEYIREHQLNHPVLIGHSMGSIVAAAAAHKYPELIHPKLILMAPISSRTPKLFRWSRRCKISSLVSSSIILPRAIYSSRMIMSYSNQSWRSLASVVATIRQNVALPPPPPSFLLATQSGIFHSVAKFFFSPANKIA